MIIPIEKQMLENALFFISKAVSKAKAAATQYNGMQFLVQDKKLFLYSSNNGTIFCEVFCTDVNSDNISKIIDFSLLDKVVSLSEESIINLDFRDDALYIVEKKSEYKMQYMAYNDFSQFFKSFNPTAIKPICKVKLTSVQSISSFVGACIPNQSQFAQLRGVQFDGNFVSTNSHAVAVCPILDTSIGQDSFFLSVDSFNLISSLASDNDEVLFYAFGNSILAVIDNTKYILSTMVNKFPDYSKVLARLNDHIFSITVNKDKLIKCCKRLSSFTDVYKRNSAKVTFSATEMSIDVLAEAKKGKEFIPLSASNVTGELSFNVNLSAFLEYLIHIFNAELKITFGNSLADYSIKDGTAFYIESTLE